MPGDGKTRILLIDDDEDESVLVRDYLDEIGGQRKYELTWVASYEDGWRQIEGGTHDVVLIDYYLGSRSGLDLIREAKSHRVGGPFIILTGAKSREIDIEAMELGAADYLEKGELTPALLERAIRYALERERLVNRLIELSLSDELTGLHNRRGFLTLAEQQIRLADRHGFRLGFLFVDLNRFKEINDTLGHTVGDQALVEMADLLRGCFRESDVIGRIGGDEFAVLAVNIEGSDAHQLVDRLEVAISNFNAEESRPYRLAVSIGAEIYDSANPRTLTQVLAKADQAMYAIKQRKRKEGSPVISHTPPPELEG